MPPREDDDLFANLYGDDTNDSPPADPKPAPTASSSRPSNISAAARSHLPAKPAPERDASPPASTFRPRPPTMPAQPVAPPPPAAAAAIHNRAEVPDDGKMFIGGLSWETTEEKMADYFAEFGTVVASTVMRDPMNGRSRGFGFITFSDPSGVSNVLKKPYHAIDNKNIDPKRAVPRKDEAMTEKLFVRSIPPGVTPESFRTYFSRFGVVMDSTLMMDRDTGNHRGFGFITYQTAREVELALSQPVHELMGHAMDVKKSNPRTRPERQGFDGTQQPQAISTQPATGPTGGAPNAFGYPMANPYLAFGGGMGTVDPSAASNMLSYGAAFDPNAMAQFYAMAQASGNMYAQPGMMDYSQMGGQSQPPQQPDRSGASSAPRGGATGPQRSYGRGGGRQHPYQRQ